MTTFEEDVLEQLSERRRRAFAKYVKETVGNESWGRLERRQKEYLYCCWKTGVPGNLGQMADLAGARPILEGP